MHTKNGENKMFQPSAYSGTSHRDRAVRYSAQKMLTTYSPGSHYGNYGFSAPTGSLATIGAGLAEGATGAEGASGPGFSWSDIFGKAADIGSDIAVGVIGQKSAQKQQAAALEHQEKMYKLQQEAAEKEYKRQVGLANLQAQLAGMGGDNKVWLGLGAVAVLGALLYTKPWK